MKKAVVVMINLLLYACLLNGMELENLSKKTEGTVQEAHNPRMSLDLTPSNLRRTNTTSGNGTGRTTERKRIKDIGDTESLLNARSTLLSSRGVNRSKTVSSSTARPKLFDNEDSPDQVRVDISGGNENTNNSPTNILMSQSAAVGGLEELFEIERNSLSEDERWILLEKFNPEVYKFAKVRGKSFEEAEMYADLLNAHDIKKSFLIDHVNTVHEVNTHNARAEAKEHYRKMKEKDPEKYREVVLNTMEELFEKADGQETHHTAHTEFLTAQGNTIQKKNNYLTISKVLHVLHILLTVGIAGWGTANEILAKTPHGNGTAA